MGGSSISLGHLHVRCVAPPSHGAYASAGRAGGPSSHRAYASAGRAGAPSSHGAYASAGRGGALKKGCPVLGLCCSVTAVTAVTPGDGAQKLPDEDGGRPATESEQQNAGHRSRATYKPHAGRHLVTQCPATERGPHATPCRTLACKRNTQQQVERTAWTLPRSTGPTPRAP